jgi:hypothetical protein
MLDEIIDSYREGSFQKAEIKEQYSAYLRAEAEAGRFADAVSQLADAAVEKRLHARRWGQDTNQPLLFEADAILMLGDNECIHMRDARAENAVQHLEILTENHGRQTKRYTEKSLWLTRRIPDLYALRCTLGELEQRWGAEGQGA